MRPTLSPLLAVTFLLAAEVGASDDLAHMSLEELMDIEVSLQSRKPRPISQSAAAVAVITSDDLRRSGVRSLPEALRLVPGLQVGIVDANKWNVTARGFAGLFANKLLVLIDGRSVYTPLFSGVFWESQDVLFEDVERIEIIRGPGGTLGGRMPSTGSSTSSRAQPIRPPEDCCRSARAPVKTVRCPDAMAAS